MCFEIDSMPPVFEQPVTICGATSLILTSSDRASFSAFRAEPKRPSGIGVIVLPDMRGLHRFYEQLAIGLASQGHTALATDYYGRTAGTQPRDDSFPFMQHIMRVNRKTLDEDMLTAVDYLRSPEGNSCQTVLALGFCFGGRQAFFASAPRFGLAGVIGLYGAPSFYPNGAPGPTQQAADLAAPILALFGGADPGIPPSDVAAFEAALTENEVKHEIVTYPSAPHSFFDIKHKEYAEACSDAWKRILDFIQTQGASG